MKSIVRKPFLLLILFALALTANNVLAIALWTNGNGTNIWADDLNWDTGEPNENDDIQINIDANCIVDSNSLDPNGAICKSIKIGVSGSETCTLIIDSGELEVAGQINMGWGLTNPSLLYMESGTLNQVSGGFYCPRKNSATASSDIIINGGTFDVDHMYVSFNTANAGTLTLNDGYYHSKSDTESGTHRGNGLITVNGGTMDIEGDLRIASTANSGLTPTGHVELNDGTVTASGLVMGEKGPATMNIDDAVFILDGDKRNDIAPYIASQWLTGFGSFRNVVVDYNSTDDKTYVTADPNGVFRAYNPSPGNTEVIPGGNRDSVTLSWSAGNGAISHDVYFGSSPGSLSLVSDDQAGTAYPSVGNLSGLELGKTYYWRIDEWDGSQLYEGIVWSFTISADIIIDDFESYADTAALQSAWTGSPALDTNPDSASPYDQSMVITYNGNNEVSLNLGGPQNWTTAATDGTETLHLLFRGRSTNDSAQLYVKLKDQSSSTSPAVNVGVPGDVVIEDYEDWDFEALLLSDFTGIDLSQITDVIVGIGSTGQSGTINVDEIKLSAPVYLSEDGFAKGDADGDQDVDNLDLEVLVDQWLKSLTVINAVTPSANNLEVYYKFNENTGSIAFDSSTNGVDGLIHLGSLLVTDGWDSGGYEGSCLDFKGRLGSDRFSVMVTNNDEAYNSDALASVGDEITISCWLNLDSSFPYDSGVITAVLYDARDFTNGITAFIRGYMPWFNSTGASDGEDGEMTIHTGGPSLFASDIVSYQHQGYGDAWEFEGQWKHYAFVKNASEGTQKIYIDGIEVASQNDAFKSFDNNIEGFEVGGIVNSTNWQLWGKMDEFRLYSRALSQAEIVSLADKASIIQPFPEINADFNGDGDTNFEDFAHLGNNWMTSPVFP